MKQIIITIGLIMLVGCSLPKPYVNRDINPAKEFSNAMNNGNIREYSVIESTNRSITESKKSDPVQDPTQTFPDSRARLGVSNTTVPPGFELKRSVDFPDPTITNNAGTVLPKTETLAGQFSAPHTPTPPAPPPGSSAPYVSGQMTSNPSLWPDEAQGAFLFSDTRAFQALDIITIVINESTKGGKKAETDTESKFELLAGIANFFGIETRDWVPNNPGLDPEKMIQAKTNAKFEGEGETKRSGNLSAKISAVIMEVFPNGLMRIEGTKIVSIDSEEEVIVISGLVRPRDINAANQVDSSKIANMRIDFYGRGLLAEHNRPGLGARIFEFVWPF